MTILSIKWKKRNKTTTFMNKGHLLWQEWYRVIKVFGITIYENKIEYDDEIVDDKSKDLGFNK